MSDFNDEHRDQADDTAGEKSTGPRLGFLAACAVVALLVVMAVFVIIANRGDDTPDTDATPTPSPSSQGASTTPAADTNESVCGLEVDDGNATTLTEPPADVSWDLIGKIAIPSSDTAGPGVIEDSGVRYCYARSPEGALLATVNFYAWPEGLKNDPVSVIEHGVASGPGYDAAMAQVEAGPAQTESGVLFQVRGFRIVSYTDTNALVDVAYSREGGGFTHQQMELVWEKGDWRLRGAPDGSLPEHSLLPDLTGYVPWSGA